MTNLERLAVRHRNGESEARERLLSAAYDLFCEHGVRSVGVDAVVERAGVARQTLYRHFRSKEELALAVLERREEVWSRGWLQSEVLRIATEPRARLLAIFDLFDAWFRDAEYQGCAFIKIMLEHPDKRHPLHRAAVACQGRIRDFVAGLTREAGLADAPELARDWQILMHGAIVAADAGDRDAAVRAKRIGAALLNP